MRRRISAAALAGLASIVLAASPVAAPAFASEIAPHRALYEISLAGPSDVFSSARGLAATEIRKSCDGWRFSQRFELETVPVSGEPLRTVLTLEANESFDGKTYAFQSTNDFGIGEPVRLIGQARIGDAGDGSVSYTEPTRWDLSLPSDAVFAVSWIERSLEAAARGEGSVQAHWFVGASPDEPMLINSIILPTPPVEGAEGLLAGERWRFVSAFFSARSETTPEYEGEETVTTTGVLTEAIYRYEGYALRIELQRVEPLSPPDC